MLRIQPHLSLLWRTPTSCQLGSIEPTVVLPSVLPPHEKLLAALREGVSAATLDALSRQQGFSREETAEFLNTLAPALEKSAATPLGDLVKIAVVGDGPGRGEISYVLEDTRGPGDGPSSGVDTNHADLAVIVGSYFIAGDAAGVWLRRDIPHLLVTFDEQGASIGPLVLPGRTPCAHCLELHRREADSSWVAVASQLLYREHPQPSASLRCAVAAEVVRMIAHRDSPDSAAVAARLRADDLEKSMAIIDFHPDCQCRSLQENVTSIESQRANRSRLPTTA